MKTVSTSFISISLLHALGKAFSVSYFVLLSVFYTIGIVSAQEIGYYGTLFIIFVILGAIVVAHRLHTTHTRTVLLLGAWCALAASILLYVAHVIELYSVIPVSFGLMGLAVGTLMSGVNALTAELTTRGKRFGTLAKLGMLTDIIRIILPVLIAFAISLQGVSLAISITIFCTLLFLFTSYSVPRQTRFPSQNKDTTKKLSSNKKFRFILTLEFLDSFSSSQLFVFLPLLYIAKGFSLENSLLLQTSIFLGYLSGRWFVGHMATKYSGPKAITLAELGMATSIALLLTANDMTLLYVYTFLVGVFARGTSPAIKAMAFDSLHIKHIRQGSALHVVAGDSGSALGQLVFGMLFAWAGINSPFLAAALIALIVGLLATHKFQKTY